MEKEQVLTNKNKFENSNIPNEIILHIYQYSDIDTKISINKAFGWRHNIKIPFKRLKIPYLLPKNNQFFI